jgi:hypothetical protein
MPTYPLLTLDNWLNHIFLILKNNPYEKDLIKSIVSIFFGAFLKSSSSTNCR